MDDVDRWKILANLLISMKTLIEAALGVIQEKIKDIQLQSPARGQSTADEVMRKVQEASGRMAKTFGNQPASAQSAKGSETQASDTQPQAGE